MQVLKTIEALREARAAAIGSVGVVPTMGALHAGHLALIEQARADNDTVLVTIFVNPTQFSPDEDLDSYPRDLEGDLQKLEARGVDMVFTPTSELMYPPGFQTTVKVRDVTQRLEGEVRLGHFTGVVTVISKLLNLTQPTRAYFGQKDAQQVVVIRRLISDLNFPVRVVVIPTQREPDGLALSSRNAYLDDDERAAAQVLSRALDAAAALYADGERDPEALRSIMWETSDKEPLAAVDYISVADAYTLQEMDDPAAERPLLLSLAVKIGCPRLLDNRLLPASLNTVDGLTATLGAV